MIRCQNCGGELEDALAFCPHCGKPAADAGPREPETAVVSSVAAPAASNTSTQRTGAPANVISMSAFERSKQESDGSRRVIFVVVGIAAALLVAAVAYMASRPSAPAGEERLEGAVRPGSPEFPGADKLIVEFDPDENARIGPTALGPWAVTFLPVVRNFTGRTVTGLEFRVAGLDPKGQVIRQRIAINRDEIEPNRVHTPPLSINFPQDNRPASLKIELTGVRFR